MSTSRESGYQLVAFAGDQVRTFDLPGSGELTIGRDEACAVCIDDPSVSRRHAILRVGETLEVEDLSGPNGTFVRRRAHGAPANQTLQVDVQHLRGRKAVLGAGDSLLFGTVCVVLRHPPGVVIPDLGVPAAARAGEGVVVAEPAMKALYADAARAARTKLNILLLGETGVGKEVLARAIHAHSPRSNGPFIAINCAALSESLLESELFGSEKGAFTGALARAGLFEAGGGGTVFLDEVGELPLPTQAKLLRVLEERAVTRLGSTRSRPVDVRFLAATNRDAEADSRNGRLRADLYFRLNGVALLIPPLRERPLEIEALARAFLSGSCRDLGLSTPLALSSETLDILRGHAWPGNVRELRNAIERAAALCTETTIRPEHLPAALLTAARAASADTSQRGRGAAAAPSFASHAPGRPQKLQAEMKTLERTRILEALERCGGNQSEAARQLGMPRRTLVSRLQELGLTRRPAVPGEAE